MNATTVSTMNATTVSTMVITPSYHSDTDFIAPVTMAIIAIVVLIVLVICLKSAKRRRRQRQGTNIPPTIPVVSGGVAMSSMVYQNYDFYNHDQHSSSPAIVYNGIQGNISSYSLQTNISSYSVAPPPPYEQVIKCDSGQLSVLGGT